MRSRLGQFLVLDRNFDRLQPFDIGNDLLFAQVARAKPTANMTDRGALAVVDTTKDKVKKVKTWKTPTNIKEVQ